MLKSGQSFRQIAIAVVVHIGKRCHTVQGLVALQTCGFQFVPEHIPCRLGTVLVAPLPDQFVELIGQMITQGNGESVPCGLQIWQISERLAKLHRNRGRCFAKSIRAQQQLYNCAMNY